MNSEADKTLATIAKATGDITVVYMSMGSDTDYRDANGDLIMTLQARGVLNTIPADKFRQALERYPALVTDIQNGLVVLSTDAKTAETRAKAIQST